MRDKNNFIDGRFWKASFGDSSDNPVAKFAIGNDNGSLLLSGIAFDGMKESRGINAVFRKNASEHEGEFIIRTSSTMPYAGDTIVRRRYEFTGDFVEIVSDISTRRTMKLKTLSVDSLLLSGEWNLKGLLLYDGISNTPKWVDSPRPPFADSLPFLSAVFESSSGGILETGTGDDLWRWEIARRTNNAFANFAIRKQDKGWAIKRNVLAWNEESDLPAKDMRFSWYLFLGGRAGEGQKEKGLNADTVEKIDLRKLKSECPDDAKIAWNGGLSDYPCFHSNWTRGRLKKIARVFDAGGKERNLTISPTELFLCDSASHLSRGNDRKISHWNIIEINKFKKWANRLLKKNGSAFSLELPPESPLRNLPSIFRRQ
jgi:hypothetical protein